MDEQERIVAAAIYIQGVTLSLPPPARHGQVMVSASTLLHLDDTDIATATQGFLTSAGRFVNRVEAKQLAFRSQQSNHKPTHDIHAFSEDFW